MNFRGEIKGSFLEEVAFEWGLEEQLRQGEVELERGSE